MNRLKLAVVGAGHLGRIHARLLAARSDAELVAVVDPLEPARTEVAAACNTRPVSNHLDLIGQVDGAVVATPTRLHRNVALDFLRAGVPVLIEKPIASTLAEADEILEAAAAKGTIVQVGHIERFNPALRAAEPALMRPKFIEAVRAAGFTCRSVDIGVVLDLMIHDLDIVLSLVKGPLRRVSALGLAVMGRHEDVAHARLEFADGCIANLSASRVSQSLKRQMQVWSESGHAHIDFANRTAQLIRPSEAVIARQVDAIAFTQAERDSLRTGMDGYLYVEELAVDARNAMDDELEDFIVSIRTGRAPRVPGSDGRRALAVAEQIVASIAAHAWDGRSDGPIGPLVTPAPSVLPLNAPPAAPAYRREAS